MCSAGRALFFRARSEPDHESRNPSDYAAIKVICSCGNEFTTRSTLGQDLHVEVCSSCHPFYTGKQKIVDSGGRVDKFRSATTRRPDTVPTETRAPFVAHGGRTPRA